MQLVYRVSSFLFLCLFLSACNKDKGPTDPPEEVTNPIKSCKATGCGDICSDRTVLSICVYNPRYECYKTAECKQQDDGNCGWTSTAELTACLENNPKKCFRTGCNNEICSDTKTASTCDYKEEYACYNKAECKQQESGNCGWTSTSQLTACLNGKIDCGKIYRTGKPGEICTYGGALEWYYDSSTKTCESIQNLGSCTDGGPFTTEKECRSAAESGQCIES